MNSGRYFRYREDRIPVAIFTALFALDVAVFLFVESPRFLLMWLLVNILPKACICAWNHHHQHLLTFHQSPLNRLLEVVYAFHTGITTNAWVLHHVLGHHLNYMDQEKDESRWRSADGRTMGWLEYTLSVAFTGYPRAYQVAKNHPRYQPGFLGGGVVVLLLLGLLLYYRPLNALMVFILPMATGYFITCWHTYYHHAGLETDDPYSASYNIEHRLYNACTGNLGYHTAHHVKPGLHWSRLPEFHTTIASKIPEELYRRPCLPFKWLPG